MSVILPLTETNACAWVICECLDNSLRMTGLSLCGGETLIDNLDLGRMDGEHASKALSKSLLGSFAQPVFIVEIIIKRINGLYACGLGGQ